MLPEDKEKLNKIEELKTKLFSRNYKEKLESRDVFLHRENKGIPESWGKEEIEKPDLERKIFMKTSIFKKFFIFSIIFLILALGFAGFKYFSGGNVVSNDNIDLSILGNAFVAGGEELPLQIEIANRNNVSLEAVFLSIKYPKGSSGDLSSENIGRNHISIGSIPAGDVRSENTKIVLFGEQGSIRPVEVSMEYRIKDSNAIFERKKLYNVTISSAPINILVDAPNEVSPNQELTFNIKTSLNVNHPVSDMLVKLDYPFGFKFENSTPIPSVGNNVWNLGDLAPGMERNISITGKMTDVFDGEEKVFHVWSGSQSPTDSSKIGLVYNSLAQNILIKKPFIEAKLYIDNTYRREYTSSDKGPIVGVINWANNLDTKISELKIVAKFSGNALNSKTIIANKGFFDYRTNSITWDKNSISDFSEVNPGASGSVGFSFSSLSNFPGSNMISDPLINIDVSVSGRQPFEGNLMKELENSESKIIKIISNIGLATKAIYYSGPFENTGPIPPKAEQETTYTITWSVSNTVNNISKAQVRATLPPWTRYMGTISPAEEAILYDSYTKEIIWNVGGIPRGTGITEDGREVSFQIAFTPLFSQIDTQPILINEAVLTGHDDFANVDMRVNKYSLNAGLSSDPKAPPYSGRVVE